MNLTVDWDGSNRPFVGEVSIPIAILPDGAHIETAVVKVTPVDNGGSFLETIPFAAAGERWGANLVKAPFFAEVDFRARRTLAAVHGTNLTGANLQMDPGGTYVEINEHGAIKAPGDGLFALSPEVAGGSRYVLPSFVAARFKLSRPLAPIPDITGVEVRSVPENVQLRLGGNPAFHSFLGLMTTEQTSIDFAKLLQEFLDSAEAQNGYYNVPLVVHSDSIARLLIHVEFDVLETHPPLPAGVGESVQSYSFNAVPAAAAASLPVVLPVNAQVIAGKTSLRFIGGFDDTRVAFGPIVPVQSGLEAEISSEPGHAQAQSQQFTLSENLNITGIDLLLRALTPAAQVQVDIRDDLGGKPGFTPVLPAPIAVDIAARPAGHAEWVSVGLGAELKLNANKPYWVSVQRSLGDVAWSAKPTAGITLQQTKDGALSWQRSAVGAVEAYFRLRNKPPQFTMPIHVFVGEGDAATEVPLKQFEPLGRVDFTLDTPALADAINLAVGNATAKTCQPVEHLDNGEFEDWLRVGSQPSAPRLVVTPGSALAMAMSHDGKLLWVLTQEGTNSAGNVGTTTRLRGIGTVCGKVAATVDLPPAFSTTANGTASLAATPDGRRVVAHLNGVTFMVDPAANQVVGTSSSPRLASSRMAASNTTLFLVVTAAGAEAQVQKIALDALEQSAVSGVPLPDPTVFTNFGEGAQIGGMAVSAAGDRLYVTVSRPQRGTTAAPLQIFDTARGFTPVASFPLGFGAGPIALHAEQPLAWIAESPNGPIHVIDVASGGERGTIAVPVSGNDLNTAITAAALTPSYLAISNVGSGIQLFEFGTPVPEVWQVAPRSQVAPVCLDDPFRIAVLLGGKHENAPASAISQVVPAQAGCTFELAFWGIATALGGVGEIIWRGGDCTSPKVDTIPIEELPPSPKAVPVLVEGGLVPSQVSPQRNFAELLRFHRLRVQAPDGITGAEVRFRTTDNMGAIVDRASFATVAPVLGNSDFLENDASGAPAGWTIAPSPVPGFSVHAANGVVTLANAGLQTVALTQTANVTGGTSLKLEFAGNVTSAGSPPFLMFEWQGSGESPFALAIEAGGPRVRVATVAVPAGVTAADFSIQLPPQSTIALEELSVSPDSQISIPIAVYAEAPGELSISAVNIVSDRKPAVPPGPPPGGVCPPTAPGAEPGGDDCDQCSCCGEDQSGTPKQVVMTPTRRTVVTAVCASCGSVTVRPITAVKATPVRAVQTVHVRPLEVIRPRTVVARSVLVTVPAATPASHVSLRALRNLRVADREKLEAAGIRSVQSLAKADAPRVAAILGVEESDAQAHVGRSQGLLLG